MREWNDIHQQLNALVTETGVAQGKFEGHEAPRPVINPIRESRPPRNPGRPPGKRRRPDIVRRGGN